MSITTRARRGLVAAVAAALASGGLAATVAAPAQAAPTSVDDVQFRWGLSNEANNGAFAPGTFNFFSAGKIGDPGQGGQTILSATQGRQWSNLADAGWSATAGAVTIEKLQSDGSYRTATWDGLNKNAAGASTSPPTNPNYSGHQVVIDSGTGTVDPVANTADVRWEGDFSVVAYSGMSFFYLSDPALSIDEDGTGELTATASGFGSDMNDMDRWTTLPETEVVLADFTGVDVTSTGFTRTPDYLGVTYAAGANTPQSARTAQNEAFWGAFPQSFVDFTQLVGAGPYWYSSGGEVDRAKPALPFQLVVPAATPTVEVSTSEVARHGTTEVTVRGTGFAPELSPPPARPAGLSSGGVYVSLGRFAQTWKPSAGADGDSRTTAVQKWALPEADHAAVGGTARGAISLSPEGTFETTFSVRTADLDALGNADGTVGIFTYTRGAETPTFEIATPLTYVDAATSVSVEDLDATTTVGEDLEATVTVGSAQGTPTGAVTVSAGGTAVATTDLVDGVATFDAPHELPAGDHTLTFSYAAGSGWAASSTTRTLTVSKRASSTSVTATRSTYGTSGRATVTVQGATSGAVTVSSGTWRATAPVNASGRSVVTLPRTWTPGTRTITARYAGTADRAASHGTVRQTVTRAAPGITRPGKVTRPTRTKSGWTKVRVTSPGPATPTGHVRVALVRGGKTYLGPRTKLNSRGEVTRAAIRKAPRGTYRLEIRYSGDSRLTGGTGARGTITIR